MKCCAKDCCDTAIVDINSDKEFKKYDRLPLCEKHFEIWLTAEPSNAEDAIDMVITLGDATPRLKITNPALLKMFVQSSPKILEDEENEDKTPYIN